MQNSKAQGELKRHNSCHVAWGAEVRLGKGTARLCDARFSGPVHTHRTQTMPVGQFCA